MVSKKYGVKVPAPQPSKLRSAGPALRTYGVKAPVERGHALKSGQVESCPENCPGEWKPDGWIHSSWCQWASVLWKAHGVTVADWKCNYQCEPQEMPSGWTHDYRCPYWDRTGRTPFDATAPVGVPREKMTLKEKDLPR